MEYSMINGEALTLSDAHPVGSGWWVSTELGDYYIFPNREAAEVETEKYYRYLAENDPEEQTCLVGKETLVQWALNRLAGPGSHKVHNLEEWIKLCGEYPEEHFGSYDGSEVSVTLNDEDQERFGFVCGVAYRHN